MHEITYRKSLRLTAAEKAFVMMFKPNTKAIITRCEDHLCLVVKKWSKKLLLEELNEENFQFIKNVESAQISKLHQRRRAGSPDF